METGVQAPRPIAPAYSGHAAYYRDTTLPPGVLDLYEIGIVFREPTFCDATHRFGGFAAPHRYLLVSTSAACLDPLSASPEWGLCVWLPGRLFKVIARHRRGDFSQVTLLEIPEGVRAAFATPKLTDMEETFAAQAAVQFEAAMAAPVLPEHASRSWLDRLAYPVGVNDRGQFFECWR